MKNHPLWKNDRLGDSSKFYSTHSKIYEEFSNSQDEYEKLVDFFVPIVKAKKILDFGCGTGKFIHSLGSSASAYTGIDVEESQLKIASEKAKKYDNVNVFIYSGDKIPLESESMDIIFSTWVIGSIHDIELRSLLVKDLKRILKKDGQFYIVTNDKGGEFKEIIEEGFGDKKTEIKLKWIKSAGFKKVKGLVIYFEFENIENAKNVFRKIWGEDIAKKVNKKRFSHNIIIFKYEK